MARIGRTIRSAKRKASTPENPIPPDHSTAARGTLPTEQTKLSTAMIGPMIAFSIVGSGAGAWRMNRCSKNPLPNCAMNPASQESDRDLLPEHLPVAAEVVGDVRPSAG
jgi:hypothetical protein